MGKATLVMNEGEVQLTGVLLKVREWHKDGRSGCECTILVKNPEGRDTELNFRSDRKPDEQGQTFTGIFKIGSWKEVLLRKRRDGTEMTFEEPVPTLRYVGQPTQ